MLLLLDIWGIRGPACFDRIRNLLLATPGVLGARVFAEANQAEVLLDGGPSASLELVVERLRAAGYPAQASLVPDPDENPVYARYYHAASDSSDALWVD